MPHADTRNQQMTEADIRNLFRKTIAADEKILCFGSGYFGKTLVRSVCIGVATALLTLFILSRALQEVIHNQQYEMLFWMFVTLLFAADPIVGMFFPRHFAVTDRQIVISSHGVFGFGTSDQTDDSNIRSVESKPSVISLYLHDDETPIKLHINDFVAFEQANEQISRMLEHRNRTQETGGK